MDLSEFAEHMPKAELHIHLEGSILPRTLLKLAQRNYVSLPASDEAGLAQLYRFRNFDQFLDTYLMITKCLRSADDYRLIAYEYGSECARQNIRYAEVTFTILTNTSLTGLSWQAILQGLNAGRDQAFTDFGVKWQWVFDIVRNEPDTQTPVLDMALSARDMGVIALGLGGHEAGFPPELFEDTFLCAEKENLHRVPHAGEIAGPKSVWSAIKLLHAERIGHGVRSIEDPGLIDYLRSTSTPLEICPTSNICLKVYPDYAHHPLRRLWDAGLNLTIGTDDPPMFGTDLNHEYQVLINHFKFSQAELERISLNAIHASFLSQGEKRKLEQEFQDEFKKLSTT
ncbi:MAG: adenosine deaminase [Chloroflexi bacterium RBG_13_50_21]|nr:MAG: adenosine deaminase [Chloroflexi bacterium RBG_13_50_21]